MSLINDALKRARQAHQKHPPPPGPGGLLRPVETAKPGGFRLGRSLALAIAVVLVILFAIWWLGGRRGVGEPAVAAASRDSGLPPNAKVPVSSPVPASAQIEPAPSPASVEDPAVSPSVASETSAVPASAISPPPASAPPETVAPPKAIAWPKLQGIMYRTDSPSALLNDKTISVGGRSGEFLVVAIDRRSVTLVFDGQTNVLRLAP